MESIRPSIRGWFSITATSDMISVIFVSIFQPSSVWAISRPLNRTVTLALLPSSRNRRTCFALKSKSCVSVLGPSLTSFTWIVVCFLRASFWRRACMYLYFPKSMIRHTGGTASAATSTRSMSPCRASSNACAMGRIPSCSPSALTTRTSRTRIPSLIRISLDCMGVSLSCGSRSARAAHGESGGAGADLAHEVVHDLVDGKHDRLIASPLAEARRSLLRLTLADHEHVRHLVHLRLANPIAELLVAVVEVDASPRCPQPRVHAFRVLAVLLADGQHARLHGGKPRGERPREVLGDDGHEALVGPEDGAVDHHRALGLTVGVDVLAVEPVGQVQVDLDRGELPGTSQGIVHVDVDLGSVEGSVARVEGIGEPVGLQGLVERLLHLVPLLVGAQPLGRARGELVRRVQRERLVPLAHQLQERGDLVLELIGPAVEMRVVLGELAHAHEAGEHPRPLVAMAAPHLRVAQGQVAVRPQRPPVYVGGLGAVHGLETERLLLDLQLEHVLAVVLPVPRLLPQLLVHEHGRGDFLVAPRVEVLARELLELPDEHHPAGEPEGCARRHVVELEEVELAPELAMIALLRLFDAPEVLLQLVLAEPRRAVDALEHRVLLVATPVGGGRREELEVLDLARGGDVRPAAEIDEVPLLVQGDGGRIDAADDLHLERLAALLEEADGLLARQLRALEGRVGLGELTHARLDSLEVLRREGRGLGEVVVEAVLDGRANGDLDLGEELLHRLRHQVGGGVAERGQRLRRAVRVAGETEMPVFFGIDHVRVCVARPRDKKASRGLRPVMLRTPSTTDVLSVPGDGLSSTAGEGMVGSGGVEPPTSTVSR